MIDATVWRSPSTGKAILPLLINMEGACARLSATQAHFDERKIPLNRVEAVIGRDIIFPIPEFSRLSYRLLHGRRTTPAEVGCYLSHVKCARILLETDYDYALICEDDVEFEHDILTLLDKAVESAEDWDILRLSTVSNHKMFPFKAIDETHVLAIALTRKKGSGAYLINRRAARWIAGPLVPMRLAYDIAFDLEYLSGLRAAFIYPLPARQDREGDTQIQNHMLDYKLPRYRYLTVLPYRAWLESNRFLHRGASLLYRKLRYARSKQKSQLQPQPHQDDPSPS